MGLKQDIVIKSQFSIPLPDGSGTRGHKPSGYVLGYMARNDASENLTPVKLRGTDDFVKRYMLRSDAVESSEDVPEIKRRMRSAERYGGKAFGKGDVSLSHQDLLAESKRLQKCFDEGKTVLKTVLSFSEEYLQKYGLLQDGFEHEERGDWRGHLDQLKLRRAIMNGLDRMDYDDLVYVGVIQIDTDHVHCHLAMADQGEGNLMPDGTQKGKISERNKQLLRRGIDLSLDQEKTVQHMASNAFTDKRNVKCYVKKFTHDLMEQNGFGQFLLACLPEDQSMWRYGTNRKEMKKANYVARLYVEEVFKKPDSGYDEAIRSINRYALERKDRENLSDAQYRNLISRGRDRMVEESVNGVYSLLKTIPDYDKNVQTPMLDIMSMDYEELYAIRDIDPLVEFGFKLRSYQSRLDKHKEETMKYRDARKYYLSQPDSSNASRVLLDFYKIEEEYNSKCMSKYQHFLNFIPSDGDYEEDYREILDYRKKHHDLDTMIRDTSFSKFRDADAAEQYGLDVYGQPGGRLWKKNKDQLYRRLENLSSTIVNKIQDFRDRLALDGLVMDDKGVKREPRYGFDETKALDMHHLVYDWTFDVPVSQINVSRFVNMANRRYEAFEYAKSYLEATDQGEMVQFFDGADIYAMKAYADRLGETGVLQTRKPDETQYKRSKTVRLDTHYEKDLELMVKSIVQSL